jgi:phenylacetate-CoA ligase
MEISADLQSADQPESIRWSKFQAMLDELAGQNSFQLAHWPQLREISQLSGFDQFSEQCPFTTKDKLAKDRMDHPPYGTNLTYPLNHYTRFHQTSGTLGVPMAWLDTPDDWQWMLGNWEVVLENAGVQKGDKCFFAFSFGPFLGFWTAHDAANQRGCLCIPGGGQSSEQRIKMILEQKADHLFCTPTYALRLPEVAQDAGIDLSNNHLRTIIVAGETGGSQSSLREKISEAWHGARVMDHYGMTEVGPGGVRDSGWAGRPADYGGKLFSRGRRSAIRASGVHWRTGRTCAHHSWPGGVPGFALPHGRSGKSKKGNGCTGKFNL